ncbi:hypothetical protein ccbrp13_71370 [Ktedonobacteria bacterium brp13]|nr:hypothetical protein ccbrp13_71370 [Ktedonobacteria bacterium brp13]
MKINVVKDRDGKVVATFENAVAGGLSVNPVLKPGQSVYEVEAKENYKEDIKAFYEHHSQAGKNPRS